MEINYIKWRFRSVKIRMRRVTNPKAQLNVEVLVPEFSTKVSENPDFGSLDP